MVVHNGLEFIAIHKLWTTNVHELSNKWTISLFVWFRTSRRYTMAPACVRNAKLTESLQTTLLSMPAMFGKDWMRDLWVISQENWYPGKALFSNRLKVLCPLKSLAEPLLSSFLSPLPLETLVRVVAWQTAVWLVSRDRVALGRSFGQWMG